MIQPTNAQQLYPQTGGANAVSINIYNPQAYAGGAQPQQLPYNYTNSLYQMPNASAYNQPALNNYYQQYMPMQTPQAVVPQVVAPQVTAPQVAAPMPQIMPQSVLNTPEVNMAPMVQAPVVNNQVSVEQQAPAQNVVSEQRIVPELVQDNSPAQTVNIDELVQGLRSYDLDAKAETINKIASYAQSEPEIALQVVSEPVMQSLIDVVNEDTSALPGPSEEQRQIANKIANNMQLTPQEEALADQLSPQDKASKNKIFAMYTLAMIQKLQRDELNEYIEAQKANGEQTIEPLKIEDLMGFNEIANVAQNESRPELQVAAIQALQHVATAEDQATIQAVLANALNSQDPEVKSAADEVMAKFAA